MESPAAENLALQVAIADSDPADEYRCPGESYSISRQVHLGRLAMSYASCRECLHRHDTGVLSKRTVARLARTLGQASHDATFTSAGVEGIYQNQITPRLSRELGAALGVYLRRQRNAAADGAATPAVVLTGDDRACAPELVAAASEGLRMSDCDVVEIAPATAACLVAAIAARNADGGLLIGNASSRAATVGIKFWGPGGRPLSSPGDLDVLRGVWETGVDRPTRSYGGLERLNAQSAYVAELSEHFHALRPLRFVLATSCGPLLGYLKTLLALTACEVLPLVVTRFIGSGNIENTSLTSPDPMNRVTTSALAQSVRAHQAHFGLWIDGDGEACHLIDERGREIGADTFVALLAVAQKGQNVTGTHDGYVVFGDRPGAGDALRALALLLTVLSASDHSLSAVLETVLLTTAGRSG